MGVKDSDQARDKPASELGDALREARALTELSLRKAADLAGISAAYLSQLEAGTVKDPSPRMLYALARAYARPGKAARDELYAGLMRRAGYVVPSGSRTRDTRTAIEMALSTTAPLTSDERQAVGEYLAWYRSRRRRSTERE